MKLKFRNRYDFRLLYVTVHGLNCGVTNVIYFVRKIIFSYFKKNLINENTYIYYDKNNF